MSYEQPYMANANQDSVQYGQPPDIVKQQPYGQPGFGNQPSYGQQPVYVQPYQAPPQQVIVVNQGGFDGSPNACRVCNKNTPNRV